MFKRTKKAQAILEYVIVLAAIIAGIVLAAQSIPGVVNNAIQKPVNAASDLANHISFFQ